MCRISPGTWVLALAAASPVLAGGPPRVPPPEERHRLLVAPKVERARPGGDTALEAVRVAAQEDYDVTHYALDLEFQEGPRIVSGSVTVTAVSLVQDLSQLVLDLHGAMTVSSVMRGATPLPHAHAGDLLTIDLDRPFDAGEALAVTIAYSGSPSTGSFGPFGWNKYWGGVDGTAVWSLSEPDGARFWWPCKDRPDDKALVEEWWTVRSDWIATGNGKLLDTDLLPGGRARYHWKATHPLTTYLVSVAATDFVSFSQSYTPLAGGPMPIVNHVYPEDLADAQVSLSETPAMLAFFAGTFGEYPFVEDQYGHSAFPFPGAMEHSANTSYGYPLLNGAHTFDYIVAHEAAHQWWGDSVSPETWADVWLNEGFATYSEALWNEHLGGAAAYHAYMEGLWAPSFSGPLYDPAELFGVTVYDKGAWALHMLRGVMGDAPFFALLRDWYRAKFDGVGNTGELQSAAELRHGASLDAFFQQWIYGAGRPSYQVGFTTADRGGGVHRNYVRIVQAQAGGVFVMPVRLTLTSASGSEVRSVWNDAADQDFLLDTGEPLLTLGFDEPEWILRDEVVPIVLADADADGVPDRNDNCAAAANPAQEDLDGDSAGDACDDDDDGDGLGDAADCAPLDPSQGTPAEVALLTVNPPGELSWTAAARADGYDVGRGAVSALSGGYGTCLASGIGATSWSDADVPPPGDGFHYVVFGVDAGCGGVGPGGESSGGAPRPPACP